LAAETSVDRNDGTQGRSLARSMHVAALAHLIFGNSARSAATGRLKMPRSDANARGVAGAGGAEAGSHLRLTRAWANGHAEDPRAHLRTRGRKR